MSSAVCPGCGGAKTKRAHLCKVCRLRANTVGERVWTETARPTIPSTPRTPQQNRVFHGKLATLAELEKRPMRDAKAAAIATAGEICGRAIVSSTELSEIEMELVIDALEARIAVLEATRDLFA